MEQVYDKLPSGTLDAFDDFRNMASGYTYLCRNCARSFDSKDEQKACKFCQGEIVLLRSVTREKGLLRRKPVYHYVCAVCDNEFDSDDPINNCHFCRTKWLHVLRWEDLSTSDKFGIKFMAAIKNIVKKRENHRTRLHRAFVDNKDVQRPKRVSKAKPNYSSISKSLFQRAAKEEMPTY